MSNKRDRRRKGVIYPGQSGTGRSQNTFFTETGKEPPLASALGNQLGKSERVGIANEEKNIQA